MVSVKTFSCVVFYRLFMCGLEIHSNMNLPDDMFLTDQVEIRTYECVPVPVSNDEGNRNDVAIGTGNWSTIFFSAIILSWW